MSVFPTRVPSVTPMHDFVKRTTEEEVESKFTTIQPTKGTPIESDDTKHILIASVIGAGFVLVLILLLAIYCYNKRNPHSRYNVNRNTDSYRSDLDDPNLNAERQTSFSYSPKRSDDDDEGKSEVAHDVSIKLKMQWEEKYGNAESEGFKTLRDLIIQSLQDLYKNYFDYRGAILLKLRKGSVIADMRLKFTRVAVKPLSLIRDAVNEGRCSDLDLDSNFFLERKCTRQTRAEKTESGYGSEYFGSLEKSRDQRSCVDSPKSSESSDVGRSSPKIVHLTSYRREKIDDYHTEQINPVREITNHQDESGKDPSFVALFSFTPQDYRELALQQGEVVQITNVDPGGWVKVVNASGERGWVPRNFVAEIDQQDYVDAKEAAESLNFLDQMIESAETTSLTENGNEEEIPSDDDTADTAPDRSSMRFIVIFPFDPSDNKELKLEVGDVIEISKISETGWWKGRSVKKDIAGWFPSSYVKPQTTDREFKAFIGENTRDYGSGSDDELEGKHFCVPMPTPTSQGGYHSDDDGSTSRRHMQVPNQNRKHSRVSESSKDSMPFHRERAESCDRTNADGVTARNIALCVNDGIGHFAIHRSSGPPAKPVPPKPRKLHLIQTYQMLAATGKLGSMDSRITRSMECVSSQSKLCVCPTGKNSRSQSIEGLHSHSDEDFHAKRISKERPMSLQDTPHFLHLCNRYVSNMKPAFSFPSLMGDQVKLSPDDDRPFLDPIPRKNKSSLVTSGDEFEIDLEINNDSLEPSPEIKTEGEVNFGGSSGPPRKPKRESLKLGYIVGINDNHELVYRKKSDSILPSEDGLPGDGRVSERPAIPFHRNSSVPLDSSDIAKKCNCSADGRQCECSNNQNTQLNLTDGTRVKPPPPVRKGSSLTIFQNINKLHEPTRKKDNPSDSQLSQDSTLTSGVKEGHTESANGSQVGVEFRSNKIKRTLNSENQNCEDSNGLATKPNQTSDARRYSFASFTSDVSSAASSCRSTASSRHEQMNLRRSVMNVYGSGEQDLSFKVGAILYELRPRNKQGLCFGLLEDSTQGWYPSEAVEVFHDRV